MPTLLKGMREVSKRQVTTGCWSICLRKEHCWTLLQSKTAFKEEQKIPQRATSEITQLTTVMHTNFEDERKHIASKYTCIYGELFTSTNMVSINQKMQGIKTDVQT